MSTAFACFGSFIIGGCFSFVIYALVGKWGEEAVLNEVKIALFMSAARHEQHGDTFFSRKARQAAKLLEYL